MVQAEDEGEGSISLELVGILLQHRLEEVDISRPDGCQGRNQLEREILSSYDRPDSLLSFLEKLTLIRLNSSQLES